MAQKIKKYSSQDLVSGISLIEVVIATFLFSLFALSFITGQGYNVYSSQRIKEELLLKDLAEFKFNEIILNPPPMAENLTDIVRDVKSFEEFPEYEYSVEFKRLTLPDLTLPQDEETPKIPGKERIYSIVKTNMEKLIWQVKIVVTHKESSESFQLSSWLHDPKERILFNGF